MREFKFKAWDKQNKCFVRSSEIANQGIPTEPTGVGFKLKSKFTLLQFTGLLDKNGKGEELYAGDVLKSDRWGYIVRVEWNQSWAAWVMVHHRDKREGGICGHCNEYTLTEGKYKKIGSIHTHPHLLTNGGDDGED